MKDIAALDGGYDAVRSVLLELFTRGLPLIHKHWGFSGGIDKDGVYYDNRTVTTTIANWDRGGLPVFHLTSFKNTMISWESREEFLGVFSTYGKRLINGFSDSAKGLLAVDKEAILNCLLECR